MALQVAARLFNFSHLVRLTGPVLPNGGTASALAIYDFVTHQFSRLPGELGRTNDWFAPVWLSDNRRMIVRRADGIAVVDAETGNGRLLAPIGGYMIGESVGVSADNRWITYTDAATEGDVWIANIRK